jgi:DNA-binding protein H-NS
MAQTLAQITKQIQKLQKEADALWQTELKGVVDRIKVAISHYGLTSDQLGFGKPAAKSAKATKANAKSGNNVSEPRFANDDGQVWSGRGPRPHWLRDAIANGRSIQEFSTDPQKRASKLAAVPLPGNAFANAAPLAETKVQAKRSKVSAKKSAIGAKAIHSPSNGAAEYVSAATAGASKPQRQAEASPAKSPRAKKALLTKAPRVPVKSAPRPKVKRLNSVSAAATKVVAASGDAKSAAAAPTPIAG